MLKNDYYKHMIGVIRNHHTIIMQPSLGSRPISEIPAVGCSANRERHLKLGKLTDIKREPPDMASTLAPVEHFEPVAQVDRVPMEIQETT